MNKLWRYEDYAALLSHENALVRKWAFRGITSRYKRQYTDGVAALIHDADEPHGIDGAAVSCTAPCRAACAGYVTIRG